MDNPFLEGVWYFALHPFMLLYAWAFIAALFGSGLVLYRAIFVDLPWVVEELAAGIARLWRRK